MSKHGTNTAQELDDKSLTICSGLDMVNINYLHVVCESAEQAKVSIISLVPILLSSGGFFRCFLGLREDYIRTEIVRYIELYCTHYTVLNVVVRKKPWGVDNRSVPPTA